jgi:hypothetical protein
MWIVENALSEMEYSEWRQGVKAGDRKMEWEVIPERKMKRRDDVWDRKMSREIGSLVFSIGCCEIRRVDGDSESEGYL